MKITSIEFHQGSGMWHGHAVAGGKNHEWFYRPRERLLVREQDDLNPKCWMNIETPEGARKAIVKAVRKARS
jgi:hypothetical protein